MSNNSRGVMKIPTEQLRIGARRSRRRVSRQERHRLRDGDDDEGHRAARPARRGTLARAGTRQRRAEPERRRAAVALRRVLVARSSVRVGAGGLLRLLASERVSCGIGAPDRVRSRFNSMPPTAAPTPHRSASSACLREHLRAARDWTSDQWASALRVTVVADAAASDATTPPPVIGSYAVERGAVVFKPHVPASIPAGTITSCSTPPSYPATATDSRGAHRGRRPAGERPDAHDGRDRTSFRPARSFRRTSCGCTSISRRRWACKGGLDYVHLLDEAGGEVTDPFLPLDAEFWNRRSHALHGVLRSGPAEARHPAERGDGPLARRRQAPTRWSSIARVARRARACRSRRSSGARFKVGPPDERPLDQHTLADRRRRAPAHASRWP